MVQARVGFKVFAEALNIGICDLCEAGNVHIAL